MAFFAWLVATARTALGYKDEIHETKNQIHESEDRIIEKIGEQFDRVYKRLDDFERRIKELELDRARREGPFRNRPRGLSDKDRD